MPKLGLPALVQKGVGMEEGVVKRVGGGILAANYVGLPMPC